MPSSPWLYPYFVVLQPIFKTDLIAVVFLMLHKISCNDKVKACFYSFIATLLDLTYRNILYIKYSAKELLGVLDISVHFLLSCSVCSDHLHLKESGWFHIFFRSLMMEFTVLLWTPNFRSCFILFLRYTLPHKFYKQRFPLGHFRSK